MIMRVQNTYEVVNVTWFSCLEKNLPPQKIKAQERILFSKTGAVMTQQGKKVVRYTIIFKQMSLSVRSMQWSHLKALLFLCVLFYFIQEPSANLKTISAVGLSHYVLRPYVFFPFYQCRDFLF